MTGTNDTATGIVVDAAGDVLVGLSNAIRILPASTGSRFGTNLQANVATDLTGNGPGMTGAPPNDVVGLALDSAGDLFYANSSTPSIGIIPASTGTLFGQSVLLGVPTTLTVANGAIAPSGLALDAQGNLYIAEGATVLLNGAAIGIVAATTTSLFGVMCTADQFSQYSFNSLLSFPIATVSDSSGNIFVSSFGSGSVVVYPAVTGTLFGQSVPAGVGAILTAAGAMHPFGITIDAQGNLYLTDDSGSTVWVLARTATTLFGQSVQANVLTSLTATGSQSAMTWLSMDPAGNLYIAESGSSGIFVIPKATGTLFGQSVTANVISAVAATTGYSVIAEMAVDHSGNIYFASGNSGVVILSAITGTVFGQSVVANTLAVFSPFSNLNEVNGLSVDSSGNLYAANQNAIDNPQSAVFVDPVATGTLFDQSVTVNTPVALAAVVNASYTFDVVADPSGNLFVSSTTGLWKLDAQAVQPVPPVTPVAPAVLAATGSDIAQLLDLGILGLVLGALGLCASQRRCRQRLGA